MRRPLILACALAGLSLPAQAQTADLSHIWRGGLADSRELFSRPEMKAVLDRLLGARRAAFAAATVTPQLLERYFGQIVVGKACATSCKSGGAFVVADTRRGEVLVVLAAPGASGARRLERFESPGFPTPTEQVQAALDRWKAQFAD
ncbi:MAG: hypothetical protein KIT16_04315 [Rhodospirillaceae bacterium]|nr:hypothetical protein [Rhodospirillaceae bacterium]